MGKKRKERISKAKWGHGWLFISLVSSQIYKPYFGKNIKPNWIQKLNFFCWHQLHFYGDGLFPRTHSSSKQVLWLYCGALQYLSSPKIEFHIRLWCRFFAKRRGQKTYRIPLGNVSYSIDFHMSECRGIHSMMLISVCIIPGWEKKVGAICDLPSK